MKNILIVDDNHTNLHLVEMMVEDLGMKPHMVDNGLEAINRAESLHPDLILMDITMPEMDGVTACRRIKERPELRSIPVIFLTAQDEVRDRTMALGAGGSDFLTKPVDDRLLKEAIFRFMDCGNG
jgi:CheY-like chemotaxis protein